METGPSWGLVCICSFQSFLLIRNNLWAWHSGLGKGRIGSVAFEDGHDTINGVLQTDLPPTLLTENTPYIWAIWAWGDDGRFITHASQEMLFVTGANN